MERDGRTSSDETGKPSANPLTHNDVTAGTVSGVVIQTGDISGGRYVMPDLIRNYATTIADRLPVQVRDDALRVIDFQTHTACAADRLIGPHRDPAHRFTDARPPARTTARRDRGHRVVRHEHACLLAAQRRAVAHHQRQTPGASPGG